MTVTLLETSPQESLTVEWAPQGWEEEHCESAHSDQNDVNFLPCSHTVVAYLTACKSRINYCANAVRNYLTVLSRGGVCWYCEQPVGDCWKLEMK